ncbi:putative MFS family arabinose efflux permease [Novosphingobium sp. SG751A]|uniref:MFS transporter n=1 Tax=Novosphingobium sp. SG751A TaxID=2587000 RepID=UPI0015542802|nr:MFS transporter [Novosphingobium sp. SG751A]NOW45888.1 putative MFS family arabinose efflux permease [Novosphingobium sp. SG751A]
MPQQPLTAREEFSRGWGVILASTLGIGLGMAAVPTYSMGLFAPYLVREFGWSVGQIMASMSIITLMSLWAGPSYGAWAERIGARRIILVAIPLWGLGFVSLSLLTGSLVQFYLTWLAIGLVGAATLPITFTRAVNRGFDRAKGLALGLAMTGTGLFGIFGKPFLGAVLAAYGWRMGFVAVGLLPVLIAFPAAFFLFREEERSTPDGHHAPVERPGMTTPEALRDWRFWLIAAALVPTSFAMGGPVPNLELILKDGGLSPEQALTVTPLIGLAAIIGRLVGGWLLDRIWAPLVGFVILSLPAISLWYLGSGLLDVGHARLATFTLGFALGIEYDMVAFFVARYFGLRRYGAIYGLLYVCFAAGAGFSPMVFGHNHDTTGNFHAILSASSVALVLSAASFLLLGKYRRFDQ